MGDYYLAEQLASKLGLGREELERAQARGLIRPVYKNGRLFYSSHQVYKLRAACRLREKQRLTWEEALDLLTHEPLYQVSSR